MYKSLALSTVATQFDTPSPYLEKYAAVFATAKLHFLSLLAKDVAALSVSSISDLPITKTLFYAYCVDTNKQWLLNSDIKSARALDDLLVLYGQVMHNWAIDKIQQVVEDAIVTVDDLLGRSHYASYMPSTVKMIHKDLDQLHRALQFKSENSINTAISDLEASGLVLTNEMVQLDPTGFQDRKVSLANSIPLNRTLIDRVLNSCHHNKNFLPVSITLAITSYLGKLATNTKCRSLILDNKENMTYISLLNLLISKVMDMADRSRDIAVLAETIKSVIRILKSESLFRTLSPLESIVLGTCDPTTATLTSIANVVNRDKDDIDFSNTDISFNTASDFYLLFNYLESLTVTDEMY